MRLARKFDVAFNWLVMSDFDETWPRYLSDIKNQSERSFQKINILFMQHSSTLMQPKYFLLSKFNIDFLRDYEKNVSICQLAHCLQSDIVHFVWI